jgi:hypothetical protein
MVTGSFKPWLSPRMVRVIALLQAVDNPEAVAEVIIREFNLEERKEIAKALRARQSWQLN